MLRKSLHYLLALAGVLAMTALHPVAAAESKPEAGSPAKPEAAPPARPEAGPPEGPEPAPRAGSTPAAAAGNQGPEDKRPYSEEAVKHYNRGVELHQSGFLNQAITEYKAACDADNRMEEAYSNLGLIYAAQKNYAKAIEALNKALTLKPGRPTTLNGLGTVLYARGRVQEAIDRWKECIRMDHNFASAHYNMGTALENEKDFPGALDSYVKAIKINPSMAEAYYRIGTIFSKDRHAAQASTLLARALELSPDADFARDAKRQLGALDSQFSREESDEPEVQMNVMPPPAAGSNPDLPAAPGAKAEPDPAPVPGDQTSSPGNMFIQPSQD